MDSITRMVWTVLKAAAFPVVASFVAYWLYGTSMAKLVLIIALLLECVFSACALSSSISQDEERRGGDMQ